MDHGAWAGYGRHDFDVSALASTPGADAARAVLDDLLADRKDPTACLSARPVRAVCRLCGRMKDLTFEHIPLQAAGNDRRARAVSMEQLLEAEDPFAFPRSGWRPAQRGAGAYVLCKACNEFAGGAYGGAYARFANWIEGGLAQLNGRMPREGILLQHDQQQLGDVARAALVSLLGVSVGHAAIQRNPRLLAVIRHGTAGLPDGLRLGLTLVAGPRIRHSPPHGHFEAGRGWTVFMEFAAQPMAWSLSYVGDGLVMLPRCLDVSDWLEVPPGRKAPLDLTVPTGIVFNVVPGDYRSEPEARGDQ